MKRNGARLLLGAMVISVGVMAFVDAAVAGPKKGNHHNGKDLVGQKIKNNGHHQIDKKGEHTVFAEVKDGKIAGVHVKHGKKGDIPVKKYKTNKKMAEANGARPAAYQGQYLGTVYIGYAYIDDLGEEEIYWFPYDMIYDGDTGAVEYVPAS
jgi:hypothetical protein